MSKKRIYMYNFFQYLIALSLIINMRSVYVHTDKTGWMKSLIILIMGVSIVCVLLIKKRFRYGDFSKGIIFSGGLFLYLGLFLILSSSADKMIIKIMFEVLILTLYIFLLKDSFKETLDKLSNIVIFIAAYSFIMWLFISQFHIIDSTGVWKLDWGESSGNSLGYIRSYYSIYFETQSIKIPIFGRIIRNSAIFAEAPMCSLVFSIALLNELFLRHKTNMYRCTILIVAIISTTSMTGIAISLFSLSLYYMQKEGIKKSQTVFRAVLKYLILPIIIIIALVIVINLLNLKMDSNSGTSRLSDFINGFNVWSNKPILGYGIDSDLRNEYGNYGFSNSIIPILTQGGIYLFLPYLIAIIIAITINLINKNWMNLYFYISFFIIFNVTIIPFQNLTFFIFLSIIKSSSHIKSSDNNLVKMIKCKKLKPLIKYLNI